MGKKGKYRELIDLLYEVYNLEIEYSKRKYFKKMVLSKIRDNYRSIVRIIETFNDNVIFR